MKDVMTHFKGTLVKRQQATTQRLKMEMRDIPHRDALFKCAERQMVCLCSWL